MSIVSVRISARGGSGEERVSHVIGEEILQFPGQFMQHTEQLARDLLRVDHVRLTYLDSEGDACTLTEETVKDALCFTKPASHDEQPRVLELEVSTKEEQEIQAPLTPTEVQEGMAVNPPAQPNRENLACASPGCSYKVHSCPKFGAYCCKACNTSPGTHGPKCEQSPSLDGATRASVDAQQMESGGCDKDFRQGKRHWSCHHSVVCDGCGQNPMEGKRFQSQEWNDYDLCGQCHGRSDRAEALGVLPDHKFNIIELSGGADSGPCGGIDAMLDRLEQDPTAFFQQFMPMVNVQQMLPKVAQVALEVVAGMDKEELFPLLDPLTNLSEQNPVDIQSLPAQVRAIVTIVREAPQQIQDELKQRCMAGAMRMFCTSGDAAGFGQFHHPGWLKGMFKGMFKGMGKGMFKGMNKGMGKGQGEGTGESTDMDWSKGMGKGMFNGMGKGMFKGMDKGMGKGVGEGAGESTDTDWCKGSGKGWGRHSRHWGNGCGDWAKGWGKGAPDGGAAWKGKGSGKGLGKVGKGLWHMFADWPQQHNDASAHNDAGVHHGITCDGCEQSPITGNRYRSLEWPDYDLCEKCHGLPDKQTAFGVTPEHQFESIPPAQQPVHGQTEGCTEACGGDNSEEPSTGCNSAEKIEACLTFLQSFGLDLRQAVPKLAFACLEIVQAMGKEELFPMIDPLTSLAQQTNPDIHSLAGPAATIHATIKAAPRPVQHELMMRFGRSAQSILADANSGAAAFVQNLVAKGKGKGWGGKGWGGKCGKGWGKRSWSGGCSKRARHEYESTSSVHDAAMSSLLAHPDAKVRDAAQQAMQQAAQAMQAAANPSHDPNPEEKVSTYNPVLATAPNPDVLVSAISADSPPILSAVLNGEPAVELHSDALTLAALATADVTNEWRPILSHFNSMKQAFLLGRVFVDSGASQPGVMVVHFTLGNDGTASWPADTILRIAAGNPLGCEQVTAGEVPVGRVLEVALKLELPSGVDANRSAWALESNGEPFGPMLILEVFRS